MLYGQKEREQLMYKVMYRYKSKYVQSKKRCIKLAEVTDLTHPC